MAITRQLFALWDPPPPPPYRLGKDTHVTLQAHSWPCRAIAIAIAINSGPSGVGRAQMPSRSMGNSSSAGAASPQPRSPTFRPRPTLPPDYEYMKKLVPELKVSAALPCGSVVLNYWAAVLP